MSNSQRILTLSAAVSAVVLLLSETFGLRGLVYVFKPLTMLFIIAIALSVVIGGRNRPNEPVEFSREHS